MDNHTSHLARAQAALKSVEKDMAIIAPKRLEELRRKLSPDHLDYSNISFRRIEKSPSRRAIVTIYENDLVVKVPGARFLRATKRGVIKGFSDNSRGRMLKTLNRLRWPTGKAYFLGLTFPDEFPDFKTAKKMFQALLKRIKREFPQFEHIWREEFKRRKMGQNAGKIAPHFHVFAFGITENEREFYEWLRVNWTEIAGAADVENHLEHGCKVRTINERKQAVYYISKYMSKSENDEEIEGGRHWGNSKGLDFSPLQETVVSRGIAALLKQAALDKLQQEQSAYYVNLLLQPMGQGWHVYGWEVAEVLALLEWAIQTDAIMPRLDVARKSRENSEWRKHGQA